MRKSKFKFTISPEKIKRIGIYICIIFTLALCLWTALNYYKYSEIIKRFNQKNSYLIMLEKDAKDLHRLIRQYKEERAGLEAVLFTDKDIAAFLDNISTFANSAKVNIKEMQSQRFQEVKPYDEFTGGLRPTKTKTNEKKQETGPTLSFLPINMTVEAQFEQLIDFLISLEKYRQLITLSNVAIKRKDYPILDCKFTLRLYSLKDISESKK